MKGYSHCPTSPTSVTSPNSLVSSIYVLKHVNDGQEDNGLNSMKCTVRKNHKIIEQLTKQNQILERKLAYEKQVTNQVPNQVPLNINGEMSHLVIS